MTVGGVKRRVWGRGAALIGAALMWGSHAGAETVPADAVSPTSAVPTVVVTATRDVRAVHDTPHAVGVLGSRELRLEQSVRTVPEALATQPGTMIQKTGHGQGSPYIRGFTAYRNLFMIDGVRLNNSVFRDGPNQYWNTIDAQGLHRLEAARGTFGALYGSDAVGGTLQALTRGAVDLRPGSHWDRRLYYRYASAENSHIARAETIGRVTADMIVTLGYSYKDFGDLEGGRDVGTQRFTGYDERDWDAKVEYFLADNAYLVLAHQGVDLDDAWRTHKTVYGNDWEGLTVGSEYRRVLDQDRKLTYLQFHRVDGDGMLEEIHAGVSHHRQEEERDRLRSRDRWDVQGFAVDTFGAFLTLKSLSPLGTLVYGAECYHDRVDSCNRSLNPDGSVKSESIQGPVGDDATYDLLGVFIQDEIALSERFRFIVGGRYEYAEAEANKVQDPIEGGVMPVSGDWDALVGSVRALYHLDAAQAWNVFGGVSQGFRAPNLSDLTRFDSARTDEFETPAPDLEPEHFVSYELGLKAATETLTAQVACFHTEIEDLIVRTPTGRVVDDEFEVTKRNAGAGHVQGVEIDAQWRFLSGLTARGAFTWMDGEVATYPTSDATPVEEYIDRLMPPTGRVGLRWDHARRFWLEGVCTIVGDADRLSTRDVSDTSRIPPGGTPGYTVYDVRAGWRVTSDLVLSFAVENITDEDFRVHGSGVNEAGRNLILSTEWVF